MKIDPAAEALGREAIRWAAVGDLEALDQAISRIADSPLRDEAFVVYVAAVAALLKVVYRGDVPNQEQNHEMAEKIRAKEPWVPLDVGTLYASLEGLSVPQHASNVPPGQLPTAVFVIGGYLLTNYAQSLGYPGPYECLDATLNTLAAQPD